MIPLLAVVIGAEAQSVDLEVRFIGNAGVLLSDGVTSLLVDVPYRTGAFGYMDYSIDSVRPVGRPISVITHAHADHFDRGLFLESGWTAVGATEVLVGLPSDRVLTSDSLQLGSFSVLSVSTPHTAGHRSYRVRWRDRVLYFTGDTEDATALARQPPLDVLFITPWLSCTAERSGIPVTAVRTVAYHQAPDGSDELCAGAVPMRQGHSFSLRGVASGRQALPPRM